MEYKYNDLEKEYLKTMLSEISKKYTVHKNMNSDDFTWLIFHKIDYTIREILLNKDTKFITLLDGLVPPKRGEEECDCIKSLGNCGCRVKAYNECREEIEFTKNLAKQTIKGETNASE